MQQTEYEPIKFEDHTGLVGYFAQKLHEKAQPKGYWDIEDFYQEGAIGLLKAVRTFKPEKGYKFATYGGACIRNQILMYMRKENKHVCLPILSCPIINQEDNLGEPLTIYDVSPHPDNVEDEVLAIGLWEFMENYRDSITKKNKNTEKREKIIVQMILDGCRQTEMKEAIGLSQSITSRYVTKVKKHVAKEWGRDTRRVSTRKIGG